MVQARLDHDFVALAKEAKRVFAETGENQFASLAASSDAIADNCKTAIRTLERQYPSLQAEVITYIDNQDSIDAVLLAYCCDVAGKQQESLRLANALLAAPVLAEEAMQFSPALRLVRVAAYAVAGETVAALKDLALIEPDHEPLAFTSVALPVDELPIFASLYDEEAFQKYAARERYQLAQQARMLASGDTVRDIRAEVEAAGYTLSN
jgi:hypothetical protein